MTRPAFEGALRVRWFAAAVGIAVAGCATSGSGGRGPLPYNVGVFYDANISTLAPTTEQSASRSPQFLMNGPELAEAVARSLTEEYGLVSRARVVDVQSREDLREAARRFDYLLSIGVVAPRRWEKISRPTAAATAEVVLWLFGGIPSWFVPDVRYETDTLLRVTLADANAGLATEGAGPGSERQVSGEVLCETASLSLWSRSDILEDPADYALSIVLPPMFIIPDDRSRESAALTDAVLEELTSELVEFLAREFPELESARPLRAVFRSPAPGAGLDTPRAELVLGILSRGAVPIDRLDVRRAGAGAGVFRWEADADVLDSWNRRLAASSGNIAVTVPVPIPILPGRNLVQVRMLRGDGERLTRTAVYYGENE